MAPPAWLVEFWKREPSWIRRYMQGSFELNAIMCGVSGIKKSDTIWKPAAVREFIAYMDTVAERVKEPTIIYRGTTVESPTMHSFANILPTCQFMSCTKSRAIAKEFAGKRDGYLHILHLRKGVRIKDFSEFYNSDLVRREKEVLLYPGQKLVLIKRVGNTLTWEVYPKA